jgi:hypothetical protein
MFPITLQSLAVVYSCTSGSFWTKLYLNDCTVLHFSQLNWFREHFEANTYISGPLKTNTLYQMAETYFLSCGILISLVLQLYFLLVVRSFHNSPEAGYNIQRNAAEEYDTENCNIKGMPLETSTCKQRCYCNICQPLTQANVSREQVAKKYIKRP